jgi:alcohol dehydrogenase
MKRPDWRWSNPVEIVSKTGGFQEFIKKLPYQKVALVTTRGFRKRGIVEEVESFLGSQLAYILDSVQPNPSIDLVVKLSASLQKNKPDCLLAIGGGSSIDSAKGIARVLGEDTSWSLRDHLVDQIPCSVGNDIPIIAIPTTAGTGAEVTSFGTIWDHASNKKYSVTGDDLYPKNVLLDPELTISVPLETTVSSGLDVVSHALESTWNKNASNITLSLCERSLKISLKTLEELILGPQNIDLRGKMMEASLLSGLAISQTRTALAHSISYPLTTHFGLPHGFACSFTLPEILKFNAEEDDGRLNRLSSALDYDSIDSFYSGLKSLFEKIQLRNYFRKYIEKADEIKNLVDFMTTPDRSNNNIRKVVNSDFHYILDNSLKVYS